MEILRPDATELEREVGCPLISSLRAMLLALHKFSLMLRGFLEEIKCVFAIFPLGTFIQDGGTKERSDEFDFITPYSVTPCNKLFYKMLANPIP